MKKITIILFTSIVFLTTILFFHHVAYAQDSEYNICLKTEKDRKTCYCLEGDPTPERHGCNNQINIAKPPGALTDIQVILSGAIKLILIVAGLIAFVYLLLGGIKWITSGGDSGNVEAARNQIIHALIGLIVIFAAWGIIVLFEKATNIGLGFSKQVSFPKLYKEQ